VNVLEIIEDFDGDTYRAVYTVKYAETVMFFIFPEEIATWHRYE